MWARAEMLRRGPAMRWTLVVWPAAAPSPIMMLLVASHCIESSHQRFRKSKVVAPRCVVTQQYRRMPTNLPAARCATECCGVSGGDVDSGGLLRRRSARAQLSCQLFHGFVVRASVLLLRQEKLLRQRKEGSGNVWMLPSPATSRTSARPIAK